MMKVVALALSVLATIVYSTPLMRSKRDIMTMTGAYPFGGGAAAFAGSGGWWPFPSYGPSQVYNQPKSYNSAPQTYNSAPQTWPYDFHRAFFHPFWPPYPVFFPSMEELKPWYKGDNVCKTTKEIEDPKELSEWFSEVNSPNMDSSHKSEQCQGTGTKYVCFERFVKNGESKMVATKYECCHGFVRNTAGIGCVESGSTGQVSKGQGQEEYRFGQHVSNSASYSSAKSSSGIDKIPAQ